MSGWVVSADAASVWYVAASGTTAEVTWVCRFADTAPMPGSLDETTDPDTALFDGDRVHGGPRDSWPGGMYYPGWAVRELRARMPDFDSTGWLEPSGLEAVFEDLCWDVDRTVVVAARARNASVFMVVVSEGVP